MTKICQNLGTRPLVRADLDVDELIFHIPTYYSLSIFVWQKFDWWIAERYSLEPLNFYPERKHIGVIGFRVETLFYKLPIYM